MEAASEKKTRFDLMGNIISPLTIIMMEIFWLYPWLIWTREAPAFPWNRAPLNLLSLFALITIPYLVSRFVPARSRLTASLRFVLVILTIAIVLNLAYGAGLVIFSGEWLSHVSQVIYDSFRTLHPAVPATISAVYLAWRGMSLGSSSTFYNDVYRAFLIGLIANIILIIVWAASLGGYPDKSLASNAGQYMAGFFFFGLAALAMGNFLNIRQKLFREKSMPLSNRRWFIVLFVVIGGIVLIGVGIASLFSPEFISNTREGFGNILYYLNYPLKYIFFFLGYFVELIWYVVAFIIKLIRADTTVAEFLVPSTGDINDFEEFPTPADGFDPMIIVRWIMFVVVVIGVLYLMYKISKRFSPRTSDSGVEEFSESLWSWLGFRADIRMFFSRLFERWFGSRIKRIASGLSSRSTREGPLPDDMDIREIYRRMMEDAALSGHKHRSYETPYEYAGRLETAIPGIDEQVDDITDLYVNVRYGESSLKNWETEHANVLFRILRRVFRKPESP